MCPIKYEKGAAECKCGDTQRTDTHSRTAYTICCVETGITYQNERTTSMEKINNIWCSKLHGGRETYNICGCVYVSVPRNVLMSIHVISFST